MLEMLKPSLKSDGGQRALSAEERTLDKLEHHARHFSEAVLTCLKVLLNLDPEKRPTMQEVLLLPGVRDEVAHLKSST